MREQNVVTYGVAGRYETITISVRQEKMLREAGLWPRNAWGHYTSVQYGMHSGLPTFSDEQIAAAIEVGRINDAIALV